MFRKALRVVRSAAGVSVITIVTGLSIGAGLAHAQTVITAATGVGTVPAGEYAGQTIRATVVGVYSGFGNTTLIDGRAIVRIGARRFDSVVSPSIPSFCCGEGHVGPDFFSMTGWVSENATAGPHDHLFGTSASTAGDMCVSIADQTNSVVPPATPPHDPGIGLICGIPAFVIVLPIGSSPLASLNPTAQTARPLDALLSCELSNQALEPADEIVQLIDHRLHRRRLGKIHSSRFEQRHRMIAAARPQEVEVAPE